jgi:hypothetical protein
MNLPLFSRNNSGKCRDADKSFSELFHFQRVKKCAKACSKLGCGNGSKALEAEMKWGGTAVAEPSAHSTLPR